MKTSSKTPPKAKAKSVAKAKPAPAAPVRPSEDEIRAARQLVADANAELESAARQLRSAHSFNDADERERRVTIAMDRHSAAVSGTDVAHKAWRKFKERL